MQLVIKKIIMHKNKIFIVFVLLIALAFTTKALASFTLSSDAITGSGTSAVDVVSGYKQAGDLVFYVSPTNSSILVGEGAGVNLAAGGLQNTVLGYQALNSGTTSSYNTAIGYQALKVDIGLGYNVAVGHSSLKANISGTGNTAVGLQSLFSNTTGGNNVALGYNANYANTEGNNNVGIGQQSLRFNTTGNDNVALGYQSLLFNTAPTSTVAVGVEAGYGVNDTTNSQNNTFVGYQSGYANTTGDNNILLGYKAGNNLTTGANNIVIGYDIDSPTAANSNTLNIGNLIFATGIDGTGTTLSAGNVGIGVATPGASNLLDLASTTKGFVMPRMTKAQRDAIATPVAGMQVYQTDNTPGLRVYNGTNWMKFTEATDI